MDYTQLIDILDSSLEDIYYFLCIQGGSDSLDYYSHLIAQIILSQPKLKLDYSLYSPSNASLKSLLEKTKDNAKFYSKAEQKKFEDFIKKHEVGELFDREKEKPDNTIIQFYFRSNSIRGFTQKINFNRVFHGNLDKNGRTPSYIINEKDIQFFLSFMENKNYLKLLNVYFQTFQQNHPNKVFNYNQAAVLYDIAKICTIPDIRQKRMDMKGVSQRETLPTKLGCKKPESEGLSNLVMSLLYGGDSREHSLVLALINEIIVFQKFMKAKKTSDKIKLIRENYRIVNFDLYLDSHFEMNEERKTILPTFKSIKKGDSLNQFETQHLFEFQNQRYINMKSHTMVGIFDKGSVALKGKHQPKAGVKLFDLFFNKNAKKLSKDFHGLYVFDERKVKLIEHDGAPFFLVKSDGLAKNSMVLGRQIFPMFNPSIDPKIKETKKHLYLGKQVDFPEYFYDINNFVSIRETYLYEIKDKIFGKGYPLFRYTKDYKGTKVTYYLVDDI